MKKLELILILFTLILCVTTVNAENINSSNEFILNDSQIVIDDEIVYEEVNGEEFNTSNCECCSLIIQEEDETVFAFRQDGQMNGNGIEINPQNWNGINILKQEIDTPHEYFFHGIITESGWVVGEGGSQYNDSSRTIEQIAATMILNNDISPNYLAQIKNILSRYGYGHFVIKSPDGRYGIAFSNTYLTGTLQKGQCLVVPNYYSSYYKVNYNRYSSNPVDAIIIICSYESSGYHRKSIMTYDYKSHDTENGVYYGVDVFATNDNGRNVGRSTANYITHFYFKGQYYPPSTIPQNPGKMFVGSHIFENQRLSPVIQVIRSDKTALIGDEIQIYYRVKHLVSGRTMVFNLNEDTEFVTAVTSHGTYSYNQQQKTLYWAIPAAKDNRDIIITIKTNNIGNHNVHAYIDGMSEETDVGYYITDYGTQINVDDLNKFKGGPQRLNIELKDKYGVALVGEKISISINGITYYREISQEGSASIAINLNSGEYIATINYNGKFGKSLNTSKITINPTTFGKDIEKYYRNATQFHASFLDKNGKTLKNSNIQFNINGVIYTRTTDDNGIATLNINLKSGTYIITSINTDTEERTSNRVVVKPILVENRDLVKYYKNASQYSLKVLDSQGNALENASVTFNINGVFYNRTSDENGTVKLNINLKPGQYIITAQYNGASLSNKINVLERIISEDLSLQYRDGSEFKVKILNETGNASPNENLTLNINGVLYNRTTDINGEAKLKINLMKGEYIITTYWNQYSKSDKITVN